LGFIFIDNVSGPYFLPLQGFLTLSFRTKIHDEPGPEETQIEAPKRSLISFFFNYLCYPDDNCHDQEKEHHFGVTDFQTTTQNDSHKQNATDF
jgi:hypothetical protein